MLLKPWYKVVTPREDLRESRPLDAAEFAVNLDHLREGRATADYTDPTRFFERTFLTQNLSALGSSVMARLSGDLSHDAVYNLSTQFGGGKTHALAMLYHLSTGGPMARAWKGVNDLTRAVGLEHCPSSAVAAFVGTEFDAMVGRGGSDGTPKRHTPWGEIAWQLGGAESFAVVAGHDEAGEAPAGDVIRSMLPTVRPSLILLDELMSFVGRCREGKRGAMADQLYHFIQSLSEVVRGQKGAVLVASIQASIGETSVGSHEDLGRFQKMFNRLGRSMLMSASGESSSIIRRRLFDWEGLPEDGRKTAAAYAEWVVNNRGQLPSWFAIDQAVDTFESSYPFHPTLLSAFDRKWRGLSSFQQTRGVLKMLALWVARSYSDGFKSNTTKEPLIALGGAPLEDTNFRTAVFDQLGERGLEVAVSSDIAGRRDSIALRLDQEATAEIKKARLHQRVAAAVFFESNGGTTRSAATLPELRLAVGDPDCDLGNIETALDALAGGCFYLTTEVSGCHFSTRPNVNKILADRRAAVRTAAPDRVELEVRKVFGAVRGSGVHQVFFPEKSADIPDRPALTVVVASPGTDVPVEPLPAWVGERTRECGSQARSFKTALVWMLPQGTKKLEDEATTLLAWEAIDDAQIALQLDDAQIRQVTEGAKRAARDLRDAIWRAYRHVALLARIKDGAEPTEQGAFKVRDLGMATASSAESLTTHALAHLQSVGDVEKSVGSAFLVRHWPPALTEWSTRGVRDAFFASPRFPRLLQGDTVKETIAKGVTEGALALVTKSDVAGRYDSFRWNASLSAQDVDLSDDVYVITKATAETHQQKLEDEKRERDAKDVSVVSPTGTVIATGQPVVPVTSLIDKTVVSVPPQTTSVSALRWSGGVPLAKYMNLYRNVFLPLGGTTETLKITVNVEFRPTEGMSRDKVEEFRAALRAFGLPDDVKVE